MSELGSPTASIPRRWLLVAVLLVAGGTAGSLLAATAVARRDAQRSHAEFMTSSGEIASTLQLAIQNEQSLVINATAFFVDHMQTANTEFADWLTAVQAFERYPELKGAGLLEMVEAAEVPEFAARAVVDPVGTLASDGTFQITPPGRRPFYCLLTIEETRGHQVMPAGRDYCAEEGRKSQIARARDSGQGSYDPIPEAYGGGLSVQVPVYSGGVVPRTVGARRRAFIGLLGTQLDAAMMLDLALAGHANMAVALRYRDAYSNTEFTSGTPPPGAKTTSVDLGAGWSTETFGVVASAAIFGNRTATALLVGGIAVSVLLAAFVFVLATGRARAMRMVAERTAELSHQALHDALTGLPNRALIMDRIERMLVRSRRNGTSGSVLFVDLDDFKNVNDTLGHEAGDQLLCAVAERLTSALRDADTIGRMGGDEFVVLIDGADATMSPERVAERLLEALHQPFVLGGSTTPLTVNTSIGLATGDRENPGDLLRDADVALYQAKAAGKNRTARYHAEMQSEILNRVELEFDLRSALDTDQFRLVYQPIYNLEDLTLIGVEALLRWVHPARGVLQPDEFIPILEQTGQIRAVGRWVLQRACAQTAEWRSSGNSLDVSVNVSARQLEHDSLVEDIWEALELSGLEAEALIIEVTETALMSNAADTARRLHAIRRLGVRVAVDDFGTGYSSLAYLRLFPVDCLKIDRVFTNAIATSPESRALVGTLVQLGRDLGLRTLAEGVETTDELDHLRGENVTEAQGFLLSRPLDPHSLEKQLLLPTRLAQSTD